MSTATQGSGAEATRLAAIAADSWYSRGVNAEMVRYSAVVFSRFWHGPRCLELGPAEGLMTDILAPTFPELTVVEGSAQFCASIRARHPTADVVHSIFEDYTPQKVFHTIVLGHVLEHVEEPRTLLRRAREWLAPGGVICAAVPNARSLHRQAAVLMGLLPVEDALNETDRHHGHRRVYNPESFRADILGAGLRLKFFGGFWLKPVSNAQLESQWTPAMVQAFMELGERYPDIAAENYAIATP